MLNPIRRYKKFHLGLLVTILVAATIVVARRGFDSRGITLLLVIAAVVAFRGWQQMRTRQ